MSASETLPERLRALRELAAAATPGPWATKTYPTVTEVSSPDPKNPLIHWMGFDGTDRTREQHHANARYIAALDPHTLIGLLDELARLTVELENAVQRQADDYEAIQAAEAEVVRVTQERDMERQNSREAFDCASGSAIGFRDKCFAAEARATAAELELELARERERDQMPTDTEAVRRALQRLRELGMRPIDIDLYAPEENEAVKELLKAITPMPDDAAAPHGKDL